MTSEINSVKFVVFKGKSWISKIIRFGTRSKFYSHVGFLSNAGKLIECWPNPRNKFQHWCFSSFKFHAPKTRYEIWELRVLPQHARNIELFFREVAKQQTKYDWLGVIGFITKRIKGNSNRMFCSEGCMIPLVHINGWNKINPEHVSPQNFVEIIQAAGAKLIEVGET